MRKRCASIFHSIEKVCAFGRKNVGYGFIGTYGQAVRKNENRRRHDASERVRPVSSIRPKKRAR